MLHSNYPIGIFDSGIGGLTVASAITKYLPNEAIVYFGDTAHLPYGEKSIAAIQHYALEITRFLIQKNCKLIVIACNTASAAAFDLLCNTFGGQLPIINVIDPLVHKVAALPYNKVGVIATKTTTTSGIYAAKLHQLRPQLEVVSVATPLLVPMIEEGYFKHSVSHSIIANYLSAPELHHIEALLLACTHYPLIRPEIEDYYEGSVRVFDSNDVVADQVHQILAANNLLSSSQTPQHQFYVSDYTESFEKTTQIFYSQHIHLHHYPIWEK
jgi:glutamate racemase